MKYIITKIRNGCWRLEWENGSFSEHSTFDGAQKMALHAARKPKITPEALAVMFHDAYEFLAPAHGYQTREDTRQFDPESKNGKLMVATAKIILTQLKDYEL